LHFADSALAPNGNHALVEGNIDQASTAVTVTETAISRFGSIDAVVANAGIFFTKPFTDYTSDDFGGSLKQTSRATSALRNSP
jgi:NAD(P)-dependent dehydrogenase (short-subunit alcohol dehydrogenase family)